MLNYLIPKLEIIIREYGSIGVLIVAFLEEIIAPIPSSLIAMFAGFFLIPIDYSWNQAIFKIFLEVAIPMSIGITVGSLFFYIIAYLGGKSIILKYGKWSGLNWELVEETEKKFTKGYSDEIILIILRAIPFIPSVAISAFCGVVRYPIRKFVIFSFIGSLIRSIIMATIGWQARDTYTTYSKVISSIENFILLVIFISFLLFIFYKLKVKNIKQGNY